MSLEVACGACQGRLVVETPGVVVACPHCGHHLTTPDFPVETTDDTLVTSPDPPIDKDPSEDAASSSIFDETPVNPDDSTATEALSNVLLPDPLESPTDPDPSPEVVEPEPIAFVPDPVASVAEPVASVAEPASSEAEPVGAGEPADEPVSRPRRNETVSKRAFLFLLSYASAATLACFWLFYQLQNAPLNNLERLPDPVESAAAGGRRLTLVAVNSTMPTGHTLTLGQRQKFGHIHVTPLKVSREPLEFEPFQRLGTGSTRESIGPVLKLWLKLENASGDQKIAPLDRTLMLSRLYDNDRVAANNFVRPVGSTICTLLHDNPKDGNWNWKGQASDGLQGKVLKPGESFETYVPTGVDGLASLTGPLLWRVHIRKGFSDSGRGVTTIFEVAFDSSQIEGD
ncbi:MAG: hypothetical protein MK004_09165 [Planctomycetales bacterium]|nr:hypothetical protein [Planctomycetales bacterium]